MSRITVKPGERGLVRVFSLSMEPAVAKTLRANEPRKTEGAPGPIEAALGASGLDTEFVDVFPVSDVSEIGLNRYLEEGHGIAPAQLDPDRKKLAALDGWVLLVHSSAFGGTGATLNPAPELTLIGTYAEPGVDWSEQTRLTSAASRETAAPARKPRSEAAMSGRVALVALLVMFVLTGIVIWIAA